MTRWPTAAACLTALVACAGAASAGQTPAADAPPVFRSGVEIVRMDARMLDRSGRPVKDVRQDEVTVLENGQPRPIVFFQHLDEPDAPYVDVASRTIGAEVSTNRGAPRGHLYVLVFDQQHLSAGNEPRARLAAERFLRTRVRPGDRVALAAFPGPGITLTFTQDVERVIAELPRVRGDLDRLGQGVLGAMTTFEARQIIRGNDLVLSQVATRLAAQQGTTDVAGAGGGGGAGRGQSGGDPITTQLVREDAQTIVRREDEGSRQFLLALTALLRQLEGVEGRKAVVLVSEGFFVDNLSRDLERAAAAAARAYGVVYALDVNRRSDTLRDTAPTAGAAQNEVASRLESIGGLAAETDGTLFVDASSNLDAVFDRIAAESQDYYLLGFEPSAAARESRNTYRRVSIQVHRPGVTVKARSGYAPDPAEPTPADRRRTIDAALRAPYPQQGLPLEFTTYVLGGASAARQRVVLSVDATLPIASPGAKPADVVFVVKAVRDGRVTASGTDELALPATSAPGEAVGRSPYKVQFELAPGDYMMRVIVREPGGLIGSADRRFTVRALGAADVTASDLVFGSATGLAVRPAGRAGDVLPGVVEVYGPSEPSVSDVRVRVALASVGATPTLEMEGEALPPVLAERGFVRQVRLDLPLQGLAPGQYVARAIVTAGGRTVAELSREIDVVTSGPGGEARSTPGEASTNTLRPVDPREILRGVVAQQVLERASRTADAAALREAFADARAGAWDAVDRAIAAPTSAGHAAALLAGLARFARGDHAGALAAWPSALTDSDAGVAFLAGWAHALGGDDRQAIGAWRQAVRLDPSLVSGYLAIAEACVRLAAPELAVQALRTGVEAVPDSVELRQRLAQLSRP